MQNIEVNGRSIGATTMYDNEVPESDSVELSVNDDVSVEVRDAAPKIEKKKNISNKKQHQNLVNQRKLQRKIRKYNRLKRQHKL